MLNTVPGELFASDHGEPLADDLLIGAKSIGGFLGLTDRQVYHAKKTGRLPFFPFGGRIAAFKSRLRKHVRELERAGTVAGRPGRRKNKGLHKSKI